MATYVRVGSFLLHVELFRMTYTKMAKILLISFFHSNMATVHPPLIRKLAIKSSYFGYTIFGPNENLCSRRI